MLDTPAHAVGAERGRAEIPRRLGGRCRIAGLEDRSHRAHDHPWRIAAGAEEAICELRRAHPAWRPRWLVFEMDRRGHGTVTRSMVYRTLVRNGLIEPGPCSGDYVLWLPLSCQTVMI
jgi:Homeodomain-like domain